MEQVPAADLLQVYSGLESDEVTNGILVDSTLHVVEEPSMLVGGVDITGADDVLLDLELQYIPQHWDLEILVRFSVFATVCFSTLRHVASGLSGS